MGHPAAPGSLAAQQAAPAALAFRGVTVIDVTDGQRLPDQTVVITGNRIQAVGSGREVPLPKGAQIVDARGKYLIPGLWDLHVHISVDDPVLESNTPGLYGYFRRDYGLMLLTGITGMRFIAGGDTLVKWRREILAGAMAGPPRQILAGDPTSWEPAAFDSVKAHGADMTGENWLENDELNPLAFAAQARRVGLRFGGHMGRFQATVASDSGASIIDHIGPRLSGGLDSLCIRTTQPEYRYATEAGCRQAAERLRRNNAWWVVTLGASPFLPESYRHTEIRQENICDTTVTPDSAGVLALAYRVGMPIMAGTDIYLSGDDVYKLHVELARLVAAGLSPLAALQAATLNPARWLRATDSLGTVAVGKLADMVLLDADPLASITNTTKIRAVVANGRYFDRAALDRLKAKSPPKTHFCH